MADDRVPTCHTHAIAVRNAIAVCLQVISTHAETRFSSLHSIASDVYKSREAIK